MGAAGRRLRRALPAVAGVVISAGLLLWAMRGVELSEVRRNVASARVGPVLAAVVLATLTFPLRLVRWRLLLRGERGEALAWPPLWHAIALGFAANNVLPFRAGELIRCFTAVRLSGARFAAVASSIAVERVFDGLAVVALLSAALLAADLPPDVAVGGASVARLAQGAGAAAAAALLAAGLVVAFPLAAERAVRALVPGRLGGRIVDLIDGVRQGLAALRSPARLAAVALWSLVLWGVNGAAFWVCFAGFDIRAGFDAALLLQGLLVLGISIPSTPGFIGPFEAAIVAALALYGVPHDRAFSYAITFHVTTFLPIVALGLWSLARAPVTMHDLRQPAT